MNRLPAVLALLLLSEIPGAEETLGAAAFTRLVAGTQAVALGGAATALDHGATALFHNPAGLALNPRPLSIALDGAFMPFGQSASFLGSAGWALPEWALGTGMLSYGAGDIEYRRGNTAEPDSVETAGSQVYALGLATRVFPIIAAGMSLKMMRSTIGTYSAQGFGMDLGFTYVPWPDLTLAVVARDILDTAFRWNNETEEEIPFSTAYGAALTLGHIRLTAAVTEPFGPYPTWGTGGEWEIDPSFILRLGLAGFRPAIGFRARALRLDKLTAWLDYAFAPAAPEDYLHRVALTLDFSFRSDFGRPLVEP